MGVHPQQKVGSPAFFPTQVLFGVLSLYLNELYGLMFKLR